MILLDTHAAVWLATRPRSLSRPATTAIRRAQRTGGLGIASVTLMEIAQLLARGRIRVVGAPRRWMQDLIQETGLSTINLGVDVACVAAHLPPSFPADPFDRLIAATAIVERVPLVTSDERIQDSRVVETIW